MEFYEKLAAEITDEMLLYFMKVSLQADATKIAKIIAKRPKLAELSKKYCAAKYESIFLTVLAAQEKGYNYQPILNNIFWWLEVKARGYRDEAEYQKSEQFEKWLKSMTTPKARIKAGLSSD